ncbi:MAG: hypothetical protein DRP02_12345 [Candidatus Gerdarchaeota archaeon]|nr:MAG: hypothetical protein DRP02_12345 [Candidatus Gerdarchaeota archaeon]
MAYNKIFSPKGSVPDWAKTEEWTVFLLDRKNQIDGAMRKTTLERLSVYLDMISKKRLMEGDNRPVFYDDVIRELLSLADVFRDMIREGESVEDLAKRVEPKKDEIREILFREIRKAKAFAETKARVRAVEEIPF